MTTRNYRTDDGAELGQRMSAWCDEAEPKARLKFPELPPRCNSCAFRAGRHLANGSPFTQMDALKCVLEGVEFQCHETTRKDQPCSGWAMMVLASEGSNDFIEVPWDFCGGADDA